MRHIKHRYLYALSHILQIRRLVGLLSRPERRKTGADSGSPGSGGRLGPGSGVGPTGGTSSGDASGVESDHWASYTGLWGCGWEGHGHRHRDWWFQTGWCSGGHGTSDSCLQLINVASHQLTCGKLYHVWYGTSLLINRAWSPSSLVSMINESVYRVTGMETTYLRVLVMVLLLSVLLELNFSSQVWPDQMQPGL